MKETSPITMKDIAQALGVSVATVSRALKDSPRISQSKKDEIKEYARQHNFTPNFIAESLRNSKRKPLKTIGVIIPKLPHYFFSSVLSGIEEEASACGYTVMVAQSNEEYAREVKICESFYDHKVSGVIVSQAKDTQRYEHFQKLIDHGIPLVFYDRISTGVNASRVVVDDYMGAMTAVNHMLDTGCRRIAFYGSPMGMEISKNRYNGYRDALLKRGIKPDERLFRICDNRADAEEITPELLNMESAPPRCVFRCQRRYCYRHPVFCQANGIAHPRGYIDMWIYQWRPCHSLRPYADDGGATWQGGGRRGCQHRDRPYRGKCSQ